MNIEKKREYDRIKFREKIANMSPEQHQIYLERRRIYYMKSKGYISEDVYHRMLTANKIKMEKATDKIKHPMVKEWSLVNNVDEAEAQKLVFAIREMISKKVEPQTPIKRFIKWLISLLSLNK